ncbi:hypothetical protein D3C85_1460060 [compost metagenome]
MYLSDGGGITRVNVKFIIDLIRSFSEIFAESSDNQGAGKRRCVILRLCKLVDIRFGEYILVHTQHLCNL